MFLRPVINIDPAAAHKSENEIITGAWTFNGALDIAKSFSLSGVISPPQLTSNQNNYNPTGLSGASVLRLSSDASRDITGLQGGADGRLLFIPNVGSNDIVLKDENASSSAANRFALNSDVTIQADNLVILQYDSTSSRWRADDFANLWEESGGNTQLITADDIHFQNTKAIAMLCDNGPTLPTSPAPLKSQWFRHITTGRDILYQYDGVAWSPLFLFDAAIVYVNADLGDDTQENGTAVGTSAFETIQYAIDQAARHPGNASAALTINVAAGTCSEVVDVNPVINYPVLLKGTLVEESSATQDSSVQGNGATPGNITDAGAFAGQANRLLHSSNNDEHRVINSVVANTGTIIGTWSAAPTGTYTIYSWGTTIDGGAGTALTIRAGQKDITVEDMAFTSTGTNTVEVTGLSVATFNRIRKINGRFAINKGSRVDIVASEIKSASGINVIIDTKGFGFLQGCKIYGTPARNISMANGSSLTLIGGTLLDGASDSLRCFESTVGISTSASLGYTQVRNSTRGINATIITSVRGVSVVQFSGNGTDVIPVGNPDSSFTV